jgi:hypothetical protein
MTPCPGLNISTRAQEFEFHDLSIGGGRLMRLISLWRRLFSNRRSFDARVGFVLRRALGFLAALRISLTSRLMASWRFRSCVRNRLASTIKLDESITFSGVKPLDSSRFALGHDCFTSSHNMFHLLLFYHYRCHNRLAPGLLVEKVG